MATDGDFIPAVEALSAGQVLRPNLPYLICHETKSAAVCNKINNGCYIQASH